MKTSATKNRMMKKSPRNKRRNEINIFVNIREVDLKPERITHVT
jgi:hypothetical protein